MRTLDFSEYRDLISFEKLRHFEAIFLGDIDMHYYCRIDGLDSGNNIQSFYADRKHFKNINDFIVHIFGIQSSNGFTLEPKEDFFERTLQMKPFNKQDFEKYLNGLFEGFMEYYKNSWEDLHFWNIQINIDSFVQAYKLDEMGSQSFSAEINDQYMFFRSF